MLQEALARSAQALFESGLPATPRDPASELLALARNHYKALWEHRELIRVAMGEFGEHPESTHVACEASARFDRELKSYLTQLKVQGLASGDWDPDAAAAMLLGTLFSDVMGRDCMPQCYSLDQDAAVTEYLSLFLRAIGVETAAHVRATRSRSVGVRRFVCPLNVARRSWSSRCRWGCRSRPAPAVHAQAPAASAASVRTLTLEEALSIAEKTSERVAIAEAGIVRADGGNAAGAQRADAAAVRRRVVRPHAEVGVRGPLRDRPPEPGGRAGRRRGLLEPAVRPGERLPAGAVVHPGAVLRRPHQGAGGAGGHPPRQRRAEPHLRAGAEHAGRRRGVLRRGAHRLAGVHRRADLRPGGSVADRDERPAHGRPAVGVRVAPRARRPRFPAAGRRARAQQPRRRLPPAEAAARPAARSAAGALGRSRRPGAVAAHPVCGLAGGGRDRGRAADPAGGDAGRQRSESRRAGHRHRARRAQARPVVPVRLRPGGLPELGAQLHRLASELDARRRDVRADSRRRPHQGQSRPLRARASTRRRPTCGWPRNSTRSIAPARARTSRRRAPNGRPAAAPSSRRSAPTRSPSCASTRGCPRSWSSRTRGCSWRRRR